MNGISSCELINRISSKEPHSAQKQLREEFMNLNLTEEEAKVKEKHMKYLLCIKTKSTQGPGHVLRPRSTYATDLHTHPLYNRNRSTDAPSCGLNEVEDDSFDDKDDAQYDEVYEQPYSLL